MNFAPTIFKPAQVTAALRYLAEVEDPQEQDRVSIHLTFGGMVEAEINMSAAKVQEERVGAETVGDAIVLAAMAAGFRA